MSQASRHIDWCRKKADLEIEDCVRLGKRKRHKGLLKIGPDKGMAIKHLEKAKHNLRATMLLKESNFEDWPVSAVFYAIYHCFLSIAAKFGYESGNQACTISLIEYLEETGKIDIGYVTLLKHDINGSLIDMREDYTYGINISIGGEDKLERLVEICKDVIEKTKGIIYDDEMILR